MLRTRATGRCSTAPAEALQTAGVTSAARRSGITTPAAPAHSAVRQIEPRFCGSWTWSSATSSGCSPREQLLGARVGVGARPRRRRPGGRPSRSGARSPRRGDAYGHARAATARARRRRSPRPRPPRRRAARAAPRARGCARRGSRRGSSSKPLGRRRGPPSRARAISSRSRSAAAKSRSRARLLALARARLERLAGACVVAASSSDSEPEHPEHLAQVGVAAPSPARRSASRIHSFSDGQRLGRVEVAARARRRSARAAARGRARARLAAGEPARRRASRIRLHALACVLRAPPRRRRAAGGSGRRPGTSRPRRAPCCSSTSCSGAMLPTDLAIFSPVNWIMPLCIQIRASSCPRAARVWAASFSWWGKRGPSRRRGCRSRRRAAARPSPSTRCASRAGPAPQGESQTVSSPCLCAFHSAKSSGSSLRSAPSTPLALVHVLQAPVREAAVAGVRAHAEVDVAVDRVGVAALDQRAGCSSMIGPIVSEASGSWSGRPRPSASVSAR